MHGFHWPVALARAARAFRISFLAFSALPQYPHSSASQASTLSISMHSFKVERSVSEVGDCAAGLLLVFIKVSGKIWTSDNAGKAPPWRHCDCQPANKALFHPHPMRRTRLPARPNRRRRDHNSLPQMAVVADGAWARLRRAAHRAFPFGSRYKPADCLNRNRRLLHLVMLVSWWLYAPFASAKVAPSCFSAGVRGMP